MASDVGNGGFGHHEGAASSNPSDPHIDRSCDPYEATVQALERLAVLSLDDVDVAIQQRVLAPARHFVALIEVEQGT